MNPNRFIAFLFGTLLLASCAGTPPRTDYNVDFNFSKLENFTMLPAPITDDPISAERISNQLSRELQAKGFKDYPGRPDFLVGFNLTTHDKPNDSNVSIGLGTGTWGRSGGISVGTAVDLPKGKDAKEQIIDIRIYDPSRRLIWRGTDSYDFSSGGDKKAQAAQKAVAKILTKFPPQPANH
ncbi:MAG: DUF4136 domain-containing protein [Shewanella sp.]|nr:DUF4136 domain-containing protein [Shewanella sp.]MCF1430942.1 DUF4136 domain-containing protein [Shewanella sp.]MCF1439967.1 DUF4136 domain-containing protein [Shewanella sp.]MCF1458138.1 DUF4136 domain-containing protein [Shewanella sp.]